MAIETYGDGKPIPGREMVNIIRFGDIADFDEDREFIAYWQSVSIQERLAHLEELRRECWGKDYDAEPRLQGTPAVVRDL